MKNKLLIVLLSSILILSACKIDDKEKILKLEQEGKIPANLDRTDSLLGIDANNNGVRDDIEKYIEQNYPNQIKESMQLAKSLQSIFTINLRNEEILNYIDNSIIRAITCIDSLVEKNKLIGSNNTLITTYKIVTEIRNLTTNTKSRLMFYLDYNDTRDGTTTSFPEGDSCDK